MDLRNEECISLTKTYLQNYRRWQAESANLGREAEELAAVLADVPAAIAKYGDEPGGGSSELNTIEQSAERRMKLEERLHATTARKRKLDGILTRVYTALGALNDQPRSLLISHYMDGASWIDIAAGCYYSERWTRERGHRALAMVSEMIFGLWIT